MLTGAPKALVKKSNIVGFILKYEDMIFVQPKIVVNTTPYLIKVNFSPHANQGDQRKRKKK